MRCWEGAVGIEFTLFIIQLADIIARVGLQLKLRNEVPLMRVSN